MIPPSHQMLRVTGLLGIVPECDSHLHREADSRPRWNTREAIHLAATPFAFLTWGWWAGSAGPTRARGRPPSWRSLADGAAGLDQPVVVGQHDRLNAVPDAELAQDVVDVGLDGRLTDVETLGDL